MVDILKKFIYYNDNRYQLNAICDKRTKGVKDEKRFFNLWINYRKMQQSARVCEDFRY